MKGNKERTAEMRLDTKMSVRKIQRQRWDKDNCSDLQQKEVTGTSPKRESLMPSAEEYSG
jgi:hypothetical protein